MTPEAWDCLDIPVAAAALILAVAEGRDSDIPVILGGDPAGDRSARVACKLAGWVLLVHERGFDPAGFAQAMIREAAGHGPLAGELPS
jgi:hypothetical protein